ncbi:MAG: acyclic terpene utilization AtuA family protein, partial [Rhizobiales bacterium]|nr:acyclic terpene utilization AtuA family protein [Hyphomicrobiales bacterium]
ATALLLAFLIVLGPLIHEFGWKEHDYDLLSAGSLAGHVVECGTQATGGIITDWREAAAGWDNMGFPIAECRAERVSRPRGMVRITSFMRSSL